MKILITNDDGIESPSLLSLFDALKKNHDVWVMAPDRERSACSQSITTHDAMIVQQKGPNQFSCSGTPADCVLVALKGYFDFNFDLVLSGINYGPNLGSDIIYSGTAAGARQGAMMGVPSAALSQCFGDSREADFTLPIQWVEKNLEAMQKAWISSCFVNINFPVNMDHFGETVYSLPGVRVYQDKLEVQKSPEGEDFCFFTFQGWPQAQLEPDTDVLISSENKISLTLVNILPHGQLPPREQQILFRPLKERS